MGNKRVYTVDYYSAVNKKEVLPFVITWVKLEGVVLIELNQILPNFTYM